MELYFLNELNEKILIGEPEDNKEADMMINEYIELKNFKSYYKNVTNMNNGVIIDFGSHYEFFILYY